MLFACNSWLGPYTSTLKSSLLKTRFALQSPLLNATVTTQAPGAPLVCYSEHLGEHVSYLNKKAQEERVLMKFEKINYYVKPPKLIIN